MSWRLEFLKLTVPELVRKFYTFCVTRMFIPLSQQRAYSQYCDPYESSTRGHRIFMEANSCNLCRPRRVHCRLKADRLIIRIRNASELCRKNR
jgi:hypothetical protein